jgi:FKBP-type peptidyl-prolyl cis-trans isomerase
MKHILLAGGIALIAMTSCNSEGGSTTELKDQKDSLSYALGVLIGQNLQESELTDINYETFLKGAKDHRDSTEAMDLQAADEYVRTVLDRRELEKTKAHTEENNAFIEGNKSKPGIQTTASGLQYKIDQEGTGVQPDANDSVQVHYHGTLIDGTVFDSSKDTDTPVTFLLSRPMISGFVEGIQLMKEGGKSTFYIPSELGYGERGAGRIQPGSALIFEVELLKVYSVN